MKSDQAVRYPEIDRPLVAMAKEFAADSRTGWHSHARGQLIFAVRGLMAASVENGAWIIPVGYALWMPPGFLHDVAMRGDVSMRTTYIAADAAASLPVSCCVLAASPLLQAALVALVAEDPLYDQDGRGGHLAALVLDEIARTPPTPFALPMPRDPRLAKLARALIADPGLGLDIDGWADVAGLSRRTLTRGFRAETGLSFGAWRRRLRLLEAAALQADGEPLARVAHRLGYRNLAAFRAMAKRERGSGLQSSDILNAADHA